MLQDMRTLSQAIRARRSRRGSLEMSMPEPVLEYDDKGHVSGAHFAAQDESHQLIEDFMLAANEAVAAHFDRMKVPFLRRIHPAPDPRKLEAFVQFARTLDYKLPRRPSRFDLQRVLDRKRENEPSGTRSITRCFAASSRLRTRRSRTNTLHWPAITIATSPRRSAVIRT